MLIQFSVKNFMSFKDKVTFSMQAGNGDENEVNIAKISNESLLKTTAIYGANASGKTNLIKAFRAAILMVRKSSTRQINEKLLEMESFAFDKDTILAPCEFEFVFLVEGIKYVYGFSADKEKVYEEYLEQYLSAKSTTIFERKNVNEYKFLQSDAGKLNSIKTQNTENKLFLATATQWNYSKTKVPYLWFVKNIDTYTGGINLNDFLIDSYSKDKNGELKKFTLRLLKEADIIIKDFFVDVKEKEIDNGVSVFFQGMKYYPNIRREVKIGIIHEIEHEEGNKENYELNFTNESSGTQILFSMAPILKDAFENGKILVVDEMERSLHPNLVELMVKFFHNPEINKGNAQLIFNTHDTNLLSLNIFRRDQIWFAEKDKKGATDLYPLDDFSVRKTENIYKGYINGRYGAIPFVATGNSLWED